MNFHKFTNDYSEGAHPRILEAMINANLTQNPGYGLDSHCEKARELIIKECSGPDGVRSDLAVHFLVGGTQTNKTVIDAALRPHQAVIAASTGHVNVHETGAIEATGHKVIAIPHTDGKLTVPEIEKALAAHPDEHMVQPKMVYISNTTELGTQYTKKELEDLSRLCRRKNLYLFLDGARLGSALTSSVNDLTLADLADLTDVFYIGGTKNGALMGEALVIRNDRIKEDFRYFIKQNGALLAKGWLLGDVFYIGGTKNGALMGEALVIRNDRIKEDFRYFIKQNGALLAKGWLLGIQFETLFTDGLFYEMASHANEMAQLIRQGFTDRGFSFLAPSLSNQLFPIVDDRLAEILMSQWGGLCEKKTDENHTAVRLVTSWATPKDAVEELLKALD